MRTRREFSRTVAAVAAALLLLASGCGDSGNPDSGDYGNLLNSPAGLVLVAEEHPTGWGRADCFLCHEVRSMHTVNRTGLPDCADVDPVVTGCLDLGEVQSIVRTRGEQSCALCHGNNGVEP